LVAASAALGRIGCLSRRFPRGLHRFSPLLQLLIKCIGRISCGKHHRRGCCSIEKDNHFFPVALGTVEELEPFNVIHGAGVERPRLPGFGIEEVGVVAEAVGGVDGVGEQLACVVEVLPIDVADVAVQPSETMNLKSTMALRFGCKDRRLPLEHGRSNS